MKIALKVVLYIFITIFSLFGIVFFRDVPAVRIWDNYRVFYVEKNLNLFEVLSDVNKEGVISKDTQKYPESNDFTPIMMKYSIKNFSPKELRDVFFSDMEKKYQLFYVEESFVESIEKELKNKNISYGTDAKANIPIICPIICFALLIALSVFSKSKVKFVLAKLPFVFFAYAVPYYSVAISTCCFLSFLFLFEVYFIRDNWIKSILKKPLILVFFIICILMIFLCGIRAILLFILANIAWFCILRLSSCFNQKLIYGFSMKQILPLKYVKIKKQVNLKFSIAFFVSILILFILFCFSSSFKANLRENNLFLPGPSEYTDGGIFTKLEENYTYVKKSNAENQNNEFLPNIFDFVDETWFISTYPYQKIDVTSNNTTNFVDIGYVVSIPEYKKTSNGLVSQSDKILFTFDEEYISNSIKKFEKSLGVEKLLSSQEPYTNIVYSSGGKVENTVLMWIVGFIGLILAGLFTLFCFNKRQM